MSVKLQSLKIEFTGPNQHLYSNGNQQLPVTITARKMEGRDVVDLIPEEKDSIRVVERSGNVNAELPPGWSCDTEQNGFDEGPRRGDAPAPSTPPRYASGRNVATRYLRTTDDTSRQLMATIKIGGTTFTSNQRGFDSYLKVSPKVPYVIRADSLTKHREDAYTKEISKNKNIDLDIYSWGPLPFSLKIVRQTFADYLPNFFGRHYPFYLSGSSPLICNSLIKPEFASLNVNDFITNQSSENFWLRSADAYIRGVRTHADTHWYKSSGEKPYISTTITDNFGCIHSYRCYSEDNHNILVLKDA